MRRHILNSLKEWKNSKTRKPLILQGARQVGKTWILKKFGMQEYDKTVYLNFENSERLRTIFSIDFDIARIISTIEIEVGFKINSDNCLIIFDEIQEADRGTTALKYFFENHPEYHIIAAGSLLGISIQNSSFPVGKVDFLKMYPMSFIEFLEALDKDLLVEQLNSKNWSVVDTFHEQLIELLRIYYFIGGMPEVIANYTLNKDLSEVRNIQIKILQGYENDFTKYAPINEVQRIRLVWQHLISQLSKENKKFIYGQVKKGSRAKDFESAIYWLVNAGLVIKVDMVHKPTIPLNAYADFDIFKLYCVDIGLINALAMLDSKIILEKNNILTEFKGALTEQFVAQQLFMVHKLYYWSSTNATSEVDFLIQKENVIIPIEVKAEENLKAKSLRVFVEKYQSQLALRLSMNKKRKQDWLTNLPLYAVNTI
ncbi:MAG TPA: ATP-binding protein [Saprospiraceae bacterium]|nr:ATP-binding protein [Saprospiraceae bacterium]